MSVYLTFFIAACLKGITGLGFSTICLPILATVVEPKVSIPLVILPSLLSNALVMMQAGGLGQAVNRFWPIYVSAIPGLFLGVFVLHSTNSGVSRALLGVILIVHSVWALRTEKVVLHKRYEVWFSGPVGFSTGLINGITGSQVMPLLPFLLSLGLRKETFVQGINVSFTISSIVMLFLLGRIGLLTSHIVRTSLVGLIPVAIGIFIGTQLRGALPEERFRQVVLMLLLAAGISLIIRASAC